MLPKAGSAGLSASPLPCGWGTGGGSTSQTARSQHTRPSHTHGAAGAQRPAPQPPGLQSGLCLPQAARKRAEVDQEGVYRHSQICLEALMRWDIDPQPFPQGSHPQSRTPAAGRARQSRS